MKRYLLVSVLILIFASSLLSDYTSDKSRGNSAYKKGDYLTAYKYLYKAYKVKKDDATKKKLIFLAKKVKSHLVEKVMKNSGIIDQVGELKASFNAMGPAFAQDDDGRIDPEIYKKIIKAGGEIYDQDEILKNVRYYLHKKYYAPYMIENLIWLDTKTGKKITALEIEGSSSENAMKIMKYAEKFKESSANQVKLKLVKRLIKATNLEEHVRMKSRVMADQLGKGINDASEGAELIPEAKINQLKGLFEKSMLEGYEKTMIGVYMYIYRNATDKELEKYVLYLESKPARWFSKVASEAFRYGMGIGARKYGKALGRIMLTRGDDEKKHSIGWRYYSFPEMGYRVMFPLKPKYLEQNVAGEGEDPVMLEFEMVETQICSYTVAVMNGYFANANKEEIDVIMKSAADASVQKGGKEISRKWGHVGGHRTLDMVMKSDSLITYNRLIMVNGSFFQIMYIALIEADDKKNRLAFRDSFEPI